MVKSKFSIFIVLSLFLILSFGIASAGFFDFVKDVFNGGITGNVIADSSRIINIDFGSENTTKTGSAAVGSSGDFWNSMRAYSHLSKDYFVSSIRFANGQPSTAFMNVIGFYSTWEADYAINDPMMDTYIYSYQNAARPVSKIVLSAVPSGTYDFYIYGHEGDYGEQYELISGASYGVKSTSYNSQIYSSTSWTESLHFIVFEDVNVSVTKNVTIIVGNSTSKKSYSGGIINGLQIVPANTDRTGQNQSNQTGSCVDSDGGLNYYVKGIVNGTTSGSATDVCNNNSPGELFEFRCEVGGRVSGSYPYQCPFGCSNGACNQGNFTKIVDPQNPSHYCLIEDPTSDKNIFGRRAYTDVRNGIIETITDEDVCQGNNLWETRCFLANGFLQRNAGLESCPNGCWEGACMPLTQNETNSTNQSVNSSIRYVRQGANGTGLGTDWTNAYFTLPSKLARGSTYYIADGNYSGYTFDDPASGTQYITIKKATVDNHGTNTGWSSDYGDGQVVFNGPLLHNVAGGGYIEIDGQEQYGFKVDFNASYQGSLGFGFIAGGTGTQLKNIDFDGVSQTGFYNYPYELNCIRAVVQSQISDVFISNISCHGASTLLIDSAANYKMIVQNSIFYNSLSSNINYPSNVFVSYGNGVTFRNNKIYNFVNGVMVLGNNGNFYNNIIYNAVSSSLYVSKGIEVGYVQAPPLNGVKIYGNTIANVLSSGINFRVQCNGCEVKNNLGFNTSFISFGPSVSNASNRIYNDPRMFTSFLTNDYRLANSTINGTYLSAPYDKDFEGKSRAVVDGNWDIGAYEYIASSCNVSKVLNITYNPDVAVPYKVGESTYNIRTAYSGYGLYVNDESLTSESLEVGKSYTISDGTVFTILAITPDYPINYIVNVKKSCPGQVVYCEELVNKKGILFTQFAGYNLTRNQTRSGDFFGDNYTSYEVEYASSNGSDDYLAAAVYVFANKNANETRLFYEEIKLELAWTTESVQLNNSIAQDQVYVVSQGSEYFYIWYNHNVLVLVGADSNSNVYGTKLNTDVIAFIAGLQDNAYEYIDSKSNPYNDIVMNLASQYLSYCRSEAAELCSPLWQKKVEPLVCPEYGLQNFVLRDVYSCAQNPIRTSQRSCSPGICSGCFIQGNKGPGENICVPYGTRLTAAESTINASAYCNYNGNILAQKLGEATCQNNYECDSNLCSSGTCVPVQQIIQETRTFRTVLISAVCRISSAVTSETYVQCMNDALDNSTS